MLKKCISTWLSKILNFRIRKSHTFCISKRLKKFYDNDDNKSFYISRNKIYFQKINVISRFTLFSDILDFWYSWWVFLSITKCFPFSSISEPSWSNNSSCNSRISWLRWVSPSPPPSLPITCCHLSGRFFKFEMFPELEFLKLTKN